MKKYYHVYDLSGELPQIRIGEKNPEYSEPQVDQNGGDKDDGNQDDDVVKNDMYETAMIVGGVAVVVGIGCILYTCHQRKQKRENVLHVLPMNVEKIDYRTLSKDQDPDKLLQSDCSES